MATTTPFSQIYDTFLSKVEDDTYLELTELDTYRLLQELLLSAIPYFEFPRFDIYDYELLTPTDTLYYCGVDSNNEEVELITYEGGYFNSVLTQEEINILATYMLTCWVDQQLASVENTRMKYSGSDFKFTSQANHMNKLLTLKKDYERLGFHLQRLYKRRKVNDKGIFASTITSIMWDDDSES